MQLIKPDIKYLESYIESFSDGFRVGGCYDDVEFIRNNFAQHVENINLPRTVWCDNITREDNPYQRLWIVDNGEFIGNVVIRTKLTDFHKLIGGNGGYHIRNSKQKQGYGTKALAKMIEIFKEQGLDKILLTCDDDNIGSIKVIEKNGGVLIEKSDLPWNKDVLIRRYAIYL